MGILTESSGEMILRAEGGCQSTKGHFQALHGFTYAKSYINKPKLNYSFGCPRNVILSESIRNRVVSTSEATCLVDPCYPLNESNLVLTSLFSVQYNFLVPSAYKSLSFCTVTQSSYL